MGQAITAAVMKRQLDQVRQSAIAVTCGWQVEADGLTAVVPLRPRRAAQNSPAYLLRIEFEGFPARAPSYVFVDPGTRELSDTAWPPRTRHSASPPGICTTGTRECHEVYHKNDGRYVWDHSKYTVLSTLTEVQRFVDHSVSGRRR